MRLFVSGGCKNGKSSFAEAFAVAQVKPGQPLYYLATMLPKDQEDQERIQRHRLQRADHAFQTVEIPGKILQVLQTCDPQGCFLLDSTTALLENAMFLPDGSVNLAAGENLGADLATLLDHLEQITIVSDYLGSDAFFYDPLTEAFRRSLAQIDRILASKCDAVVEICASQPIIHKGQDFFLPDHLPKASSGAGGVR
ncbi:MAG: bifunctional adenosylcobinamide kinase/adenosylcobinamide-phosphate guanylyltransferase [Eubacteriales bacterium]|nr:bifunctional adenosylcobinamide kinase/adenosylcobinamide-phosphate guanylyltransferase [Eubacteriales bacterium]